MLKFTYTVKINALPAYGDKKHVETMSGDLEADAHPQAKTQVQSRAFARCKQLERERGDIFGYENVQVELAKADAESTPMSIEQVVALIDRYLEQAQQRKQRNVERVREADCHEQQMSASIEVIDAVGQIWILQQLLREIQNCNAAIQKDR